MKSRKNSACVRTTDSHRAKPQVPFLTWSPTALLHLQCKTTTTKKQMSERQARVWIIPHSWLNLLLQTFWFTKKSTRETRTGIKQQIHFASTVLTERYTLKTEGHVLFAEHSWLKGVYFPWFCSSTAPRQSILVLKTNFMHLHEYLCKSISHGTPFSRKM